jgi:dynein heavy chain 2
MATPYWQKLVLLLLLQAQGEALIRKALSELKLWGLQRTFSFVPSKDSSTSAAAAAASAGKSSTAAAGGLRPVQLINEWSEVLSELGNHQSLVASLKTSHYHHLFKVRSTLL